VRYKEKKSRRRSRGEEVVSASQSFSIVSIASSRPGKRPLLLALFQLIGIYTVQVNFNSLAQCCLAQPDHSLRPVTWPGLLSLAQSKKIKSKKIKIYMHA